MDIETHLIRTVKIAEIVSDELIIKSAEEGLELLGNLYFQGFDHIILYETQIASDFFDLKTGMAGEILQKFSNYRVRLVMIGDFSKYPGRSIHDFIYESNKGGMIHFADSLTSALKWFSNK
ncbi:MAG: DUF4180 domain-containing protein [Saprospiraceae bacterium]